MSEPLLVVEGLDAYYGAAHVLQDVSLTMGAEPVALIGRNGMGKTTLCKALDGPARRPGRVTGSVRLAGEDDRAASRRTGSPGPASATCRRGGGCSSR